MDGRDDLYLILEVARAATVADIKKSFRRLARRFHPDVNPGDRGAEERFKRISEAYEVLSHPDKRHFYDENGFYTEDVSERKSGSTAWGFTFQGFNFSTSPDSQSSEIFGQYFSRRSVPRTPTRGADLEYQISVSFADSISGQKTRINIRRYRACTCFGSSASSIRREESGCSKCGGTGKIERMKGRLHFSAICTDCSGSGEVRRSCEECGGVGR